MSCDDCKAEIDALLQRVDEQLEPGKGRDCADCVPLMVQMKLSLKLLINGCNGCEAKADG